MIDNSKELQNNEKYSKNIDDGWYEAIIWHHDALREIVTKNNCGVINKHKAHSKPVDWPKMEEVYFTLELFCIHQIEVYECYYKTAN